MRESDFPRELSFRTGGTPASEPRITGILIKHEAVEKANDLGGGEKSKGGTEARTASVCLSMYRSVARFDSVETGEISKFVVPRIAKNNKKRMRVGQRTITKNEKKAK